MKRKTNFHKLLFKTAFCAMACDGEIDRRELEEIRQMKGHTTFFGKIDVDKELDRLTADLQKSGRALVEGFFSELKTSTLNTVQELIVLEIALRIIYADKKLEENEIRFVRLLRSRLRVHDRTIHERFGPVDFFDQPDAGNVTDRQRTDKAAAVFIAFPEEEIRKIRFSRKSRPKSGVE